MLTVPMIDRRRKDAQLLAHCVRLHIGRSEFRVSATGFTFHIGKGARTPPRHQRRDVIADRRRAVALRCRSVFAAVGGQDFGDREFSGIMLADRWFEFFTEVFEEDFFSSFAIAFAAACPLEM